MIAALANHKGGTGKTATAVHLAWALADKGRKTLLVDLDAQANASYWLGLNPDDLDGSLSEAINGGRPVELAVRQVAQNLNLIPADPRLAEFDHRQSGASGRLTVIRRLLAPLAESYEVILLDTPPSLSLLMANALAAADCLLVCTQPNYLGMQGARGIMDARAAVEAGTGEAAKLVGIAITHNPPRGNHADEVLAKLEEMYPGMVLRSKIPKTVKMDESSGLGEPVWALPGGGKAGDAYRALAAEFMKRCKGK